LLAEHLLPDRRCILIPLCHHLANPYNLSRQSTNARVASCILLYTPLPLLRNNAPFPHHRTIKFLAFRPILLHNWCHTKDSQQLLRSFLAMSYLQINNGMFFRRRARPLSQQDKDGRPTHLVGNPVRRTCRNYMPRPSPRSISRARHPCNHLSHNTMVHSYNCNLYGIFYSVGTRRHFYEDMPPANCPN